MIEFATAFPETVRRLETGFGYKSILSSNSNEVLDKGVQVPAASKGLNQRNASCRIVDASLLSTSRHNQAVNAPVCWHFGVNANPSTLSLLPDGSGILYSFVAVNLRSLPTMDEDKSVTSKVLEPEILCKIYINPVLRSNAKSQLSS